MTKHQHEHPLAGQTVIIKDHVTDPIQNMVVPGAEFVIKNWWDRMDSYGRSLWEMDNNMAAAQYGMRAGYNSLPIDDEIVYGKIGALGHAVHVSEFTDPNAVEQDPIAVVVPGDPEQPVYAIRIPKISNYQTHAKIIGCDMIEAVARTTFMTVYADEESRVRVAEPVPNDRANKLLGQEAVDYEPVTRITHLDEKSGEWVTDHEMRMPGPNGLVCGTAVFAGGTEETEDDTIQKSLSPTQVAGIAYLLGINPLEVPDGQDRQE